MLRAPQLLRTPAKETHTHPPRRRQRPEKGPAAGPLPLRPHSSSRRAGCVPADSAACGPLPAPDRSLLRTAAPRCHRSPRTPVRSPAALPAARLPPKAHLPGREAAETRPRVPAPLPTADMAAAASPLPAPSSAGPTAAALPRPARSRAAAAAASGKALLPSTKMVLPAQAPRAPGRPV
ncbi:translation initiation factor IF-2-like [Strigops habroptila]|uniref:translation initiation factor IF-2-like n=1 Tax=Strigops habroptila TaxID=2489341 RepID=UPI0011CF8C71|nr:translation initiation factor IF-2-like [Strigops habroptila]